MELSAHAEGTANKKQKLPHKKEPPHFLSGIPYGLANGGGSRFRSILCQGCAVRPAHAPQIKKKTPPDKLGKFSFLCRWWGSNPHVLLAQGILSPPRLPFRHTGASFFERLLLYRILWVKSRGSFAPFSNRPARRKIHNSGSCPAARAVLH